MDEQLLRALERAKNSEAIDLELAKSSALLSPLTIDEIRKVELDNVIKNTKQVLNLEMAQFLKDEGIV